VEDKEEEVPVIAEVDDVAVLKGGVSKGRVRSAIAEFEDDIGGRLAINLVMFRN
jgi:hypothetical protein